MKKLVIDNNDEVGYSFAHQNIMNIVSDNMVSVSPEQWNLISIDEKRSFVRTKMNEANVLNDKDFYNYWSLNLTNLSSDNLKNEGKSM